jgi:hypothetical protein
MGGQEFKFALERPRNQIQARHIQTGSDKWIWQMANRLMPIIDEIWVIHLQKVDTLLMIGI